MHHAPTPPSLRAPCTNPTLLLQVLLPLLLWAASYHSEARTRDQLLKDMFALIKKPNREDRGALLCSLVTYARLNGEERVASELLPHCWEHIADRQLEKRLLVAESCGSLTPHLPVRGWGGDHGEVGGASVLLAVAVQADLRSSLLVSMVTQLLSEDRVDLVRQAAVKSLAVVVTCIDDRTKFNQVTSALCAW